MASEAICIAISVRSALGGMLGDFRIKEIGDQEKFLRIAGFYVLLVFTYCWFLRIAGPRQISEAALGEGWLAERVVALWMDPICVAMWSVL